MRLRVDGDALVPPFAQIFEQLRAHIQRGSLAPGATLPTVRQLATDLGVAPNTVARAYAELKAQGWIVGEERRPTRVAPVAPTAALRSRRRALGDAIDAFLDSLANRGYAPDEIAIEIEKRLRPR